MTPALRPRAAGLAAVVATARLARYEMRNVIRSRWLIGYSLFFLVAADALLRFSGVQPGALLSLANIILLVIPLTTMVFGTMYAYDAREFTELLLAQPIGRRRIFLSLYLGLALPLIAGFAVGVCIPVTIHGGWTPELRGTIGTMLVMGALLTTVFTAIALWIAVRFQDKVRGLGVAIAAWLGAAILYDGIVLLLATVLADHPIERPLLALILANPIDLARVALLLRFDIAALMGYTGAIFERFFGGSTGLAVATAALVLWAALPAWAGMRAFQRKDF
jgi:Cu-processing system permease protein